MLKLLAVITIQWHFIGMNDDLQQLKYNTIIPNVHYQFALQLRMVHSKNIRRECDISLQIFLALMDPLVCPMLNLAVHVEMFGVGDGTRIFGQLSKTNILDKLFADPRFIALRLGKLGTHSIRKGPTTYLSRCGVLKEWINKRGCWKGKAQQVDTYISSDLPYPNAKMASVLCGTLGPCKYSVVDGMAVTLPFLELIAPRCVVVFGTEVARVLALALLWAAYKGAVTVNGTVCSIIPSDLVTDIKNEWIQAGGDCNVNPVEKIPLMVHQRMDQLHIVPILNGIRVAGAEGERVGASEGESSGVRDNFVASQFFQVQQSVCNLRNNMSSLFMEQRRFMNTINNNVRRIAIQPVVHAAALTTTWRRSMVKLSKCPRDLWTLWKKWEQRLGGKKAAKEYTLCERGANKFALSRRRVFWDAVEGMIKREHTSDSAVDMIYAAYGKSKSVTPLLVAMRMDRKNNNVQF
jgi:hypothetical protein